MFIPEATQMLPVTGVKIEVLVTADELKKCGYEQEDGKAPCKQRVVNLKKSMYGAGYESSNIKR